MNFTAIFLVAAIACTASAAHIQDVITQDLTEKSDLVRVKKDANVQSSDVLKAGSQLAIIQDGALYNRFNRLVQLSCDLCDLGRALRGIFPNNNFLQRLARWHNYVCQVCNIGKGLLKSHQMFNRYIKPYFGGGGAGGGGAPAIGYQEKADVQSIMNLLNALENKNN